MSMHTSWEVLAEHCKLFVTFGGVPHKNAQINAGGAMVHRLKDGLYGMRAKGVRFVNITPTAEDLDTGGDIEWLAIRPNTDAALILALCNVLLTEKLLRSRVPRPLHGGLRQVRALPRASRTPEWAGGDLRHSRCPHPGPGARDGGDPHHGQHQLVAAARASRRAAVLGAGDAGLRCWARSACPAAASARATARPTSWAAAARCFPARRCRRAPTRSPTSSRSRASPTCCSIRAARSRTTGRRSPIPTSAWSTGRAAIRSITTRTSTA